MRNLEITELSTIQGGDFIGGVCTGIGGVASIWGAGALANIWNPIGATATTVFVIAGVACLGYGLATA